MNVRHPMGVLHSFSIKNIFYDKMDLRLFYFYVTISKRLITVNMLCLILVQPFGTKSLTHSSVVTILILSNII